MRKFLLPLCLLSAAALVSACSISASSKSSSTSSGRLANSSSSPSESSGTASSRQGYDQDVSDYTAEFVKSNSGDMASFRQKIGKFAANHGIANWEEDKATYVAIGKGLRKAELGKPQYESFKSSLGASTQWKMDAIAEGYR